MWTSNTMTLSESIITFLIGFSIVFAALIALALFIIISSKVMFLVGLSVVIGGVAVGRGGIISILVGLGGFALAVWGVSLMLTTVEQGGADGGAASGSGRGPSSWGRFMDRNAERWDRRRDGRG